MVSFTTIKLYTSLIPSLMHGQRASLGMRLALHAHCHVVCVLSLQLKTLTQPQLEEYMVALDRHMDQELEALRKRYHQKRLPILQAMDTKKKQQFRN